MPKEIPGCSKDTIINLGDSDVESNAEYTSIPVVRRKNILNVEKKKVFNIKEHEIMNNMNLSKVMDDSSDSNDESGI